MDITLDQECWQLPDETSVMEALAQISDKAERKGCFVTSLTVAGRPVTDRDLDPSFLARKGSDAPRIVAASQSLRAIMSAAAPTVTRFAAELKTDGERIIAPLRGGRPSFTALDGWLGRLADYAEIIAAGKAAGIEGQSGATMLPWIQELLDARQAADSVRVADILEYELLPRLC
jgi:hypothetical protein